MRSETQQATASDEVRAYGTITVPRNVAMVNGSPIAWDSTTLSLVENRSWLRKRVDIITADEFGQLHVHAGVPALWSLVPPECPASHLCISTVRIPSRIGSLWTRLVG